MQGEDRDEVGNGASTRARISRRMHRLRTKRSLALAPCAYVRRNTPPLFVRGIAAETLCDWLHASRRCGFDALKNRVTRASGSLRCGRSRRSPSPRSCWAPSNLQVEFARTVAKS